jgi:hypothetical protein
VERLNQRLMAVVGGDKVWNRGRILRTPGFINVKYEGTQRSHLVDFRPDLRYTLDDLERLLPPLPDREARSPRGAPLPGLDRRANLTPTGGRCCTRRIKKPWPISSGAQG